MRKLIHCVFGGMSWQAGEDLIGCLLWLDTSNMSSSTERGIDVQRMHQLLCVYWSVPKWLLVVEPHTHNADTTVMLSGFTAAESTECATKTVMPIISYLDLVVDVIKNEEATFL